MSEPLTPVVLARLDDLRGWTPAAVERLGLTFDGERVCLPVHDASGELVGHVRYLPNAERRNGRAKMVADPGTTRELFPPPEMVADDEAEGLVWLVEGEPDAVRMWSLGLVAVGVPGAQNWQAKWAARFSGRRWRVVVAFDCDETGRANASRAAADLVAEGVDARVLDIAEDRDDGYDLTDFLAGARSKDERQETRQVLLRCAERVPEFDAKDAPEERDDSTSPHLAPTSPQGRTSPPSYPPRDKRGGATSPHLAGGEPPEADRWQPLDLIELGATPPEPPAIAGLFYLGKRHLVHGLSETGKTWLFLAAAVEELRDGRDVVWVDGDLVGASDLLERLRAFGVEDERIRAHFRYFEPDAPLADSADLVGPLVEGGGRLAVLDGFNPLLHLHDLDPDRGVDIEAFNRHIAKPLRDAGAAVLIGDNVTKAKDGRAWAIGSERKKSAVEVQLGLTMIEPFGRGRTGRFKLTVHKDRPGFLSRPSPGLLVLTSEPETGNCSWRIEPDTSVGEEGDFRPTHLMERVSRYLELHTEPVPRGEIEDDVQGKRDALRAAIDRLVSEGYAVEVAGERGARLYRSSIAFREAEEWGEGE